MFTRLALGLGALFATMNANAAFIYEFSYDDFVYQGVEYSGGEFSFESPYFLAGHDSAVISTNLDAPVTTNGFSFTSVGVGGYRIDGSAYTLSMPWGQEYGRAAAGTVLGLYVSIPTNSESTGTFVLPGGGRFGMPDAGYQFIIADGCVTTMCGLGYSLVSTSGMVQIVDTSVPEPGTLLLLVMGLLGGAVCRRHRALPMTHA